MGKYLKAIIAFVLGLLGAVSTGLTPDGDGITRLTWPEILTAIGAGVVAGSAVAVANNAGTIHVDKLPDAVTLAREAYEVYAQAVGGKSVSGDTLPEWGQMTSGIRDAWVRAQSAVVSLLHR